MSGHAAVGPRTYRAGIGRFEDHVEAVVFDLPGCTCTADDESAVGSLVPVVITEHIAWLDQHGDVTRDAFPFDVEVVERLDVSELGDDVADDEFCYQDDLLPTTREEVQTAVRRLGYAREDLLRVVRHLPDEVLDWRPPASAVRQDEWAAGARSIRRILGHIAGSDGYYAGNVGNAPWTSAAPGESPDIFSERERVIARLLALSDAELQAGFQRRHPWQNAGYEHWTVRKALRRLIAHERFHTREIEQQLAWLLLGTPVLANLPAGSAV
jgi:uncharacterized damage-inducible protein DinB